MLPILTSPRMLSVRPAPMTTELTVGAATVALRPLTIVNDEKVGLIFAKFRLPAVVMVLSEPMRKAPKVLMPPVVVMTSRVYVLRAE